MVRTLLAVAALGGSGSAREVSAKSIEMLGPSQEMLAVTYPNREKAVYVERLEWARSYCKLGGALESPKRGLFLFTPEGKEIVALSEAEARDRLAKMDAEVRSRRRVAGAAADAIAADTGIGDAPVDEDDKTVQGPGWKEQLLARLHRLSPEGWSSRWSCCAPTDCSCSAPAAQAIRASTASGPRR